MTATGFQFISRHYFLILLVHTVYFFVIQSVDAIEYCQFDGAINPNDGYPLPIPLPRDGSNTQNSASTIASLGYYECPPGTHCCPRKLCCSDDQLNLPDRPKNRFFFDIDERTGASIAITVTVACVAIAALLLVCCFWSPCCLYNTCRTQYHRDDAGCADKMGEVPAYLGSMPCEDAPLRNTFLINHFLQRKDKHCMEGQHEVAV